MSMKPVWIIEDFTQDSWYRDLIKEVKKQGMKCVVLDITNHFTLKDDDINKDDCVIFQGSIQLFRKFKSERDYTPLGWMTDPYYLCTQYYRHFQKYLFNNKHCFSTIPALKDNKWFFYAAFGKEALIYVRPNGGDKAFTGQLLDLKDFDTFWEDGVRCNAKDIDLVMISTPKSIRGEWRYICTSKKEILGTSLYMYQGQRTYIPSAPEKATALCKEILEVGWYPDPVFTVDIVEDMGGDYWLMEINSFTAAGTYAAKKDLIVKRVSEIAVEEYGRRIVNETHP